MLAAEASFDPDGRGELLSSGRTIYESFSVCYEARSTPAEPFNLHLLSHYLDKDSVYDEFVTAVDQSYRIDRRLSQDTSTPAAKAVALKISSKNIPLSLLCPTFGPLYAARLGAVAAMPTWHLSPSSYRITTACRL